MTIAYTLAQAQRDLANVYWMIRATRVKDRAWKHINKARSIKDAMRMMGVKKWEIDDAMYCLKHFDCKRCNKNAAGIPCYEIERRRAAAVTKRIEDNES